MKVYPETIGRRYFETERQAGAYLLELGYECDDPSARYPWIGRDGMVSADIRFNSEGIFIEYRV